MDVHLVLKSDPSNGTSAVFQRLPDENKIVFPKFETKFDFKSISYPEDDVFAKVSYPLINDKFFNNVDSLLLTLGPTNSGKSHLLFENHNSIVDNSLKCIFEKIDILANDIDPIRRFYPNIHDSRESDTNFNTSMSSQTYLSISMFELYNDNVIDLLNKNHNKNERIERNNLGIVTDPVDHKLTPRNISKFLVNSYDTAHDIIFDGLKNRKTFPTFANNHSSRSHCFIFFDLHKIYGKVIDSTRFTIVDLAGLERSKSARTSGVSLREASCTNGSLTELGRCLELISMNQFHKTCLRTNKLTRLVLNDFVKSNNPVNILITLDPFGEEGLILQTLRYIDPIKYQDLQRKSLMNIRSKSKNVVGKIEQKHFTDEIDKLRSLQKTLKLKIQSLENSLLENENKIRNELYKEHENNLLQITLDHKREIEELSRQSSSNIDKKLQDQSNSFASKIKALNDIIEMKEKELTENVFELNKANSDLEKLNVEYRELTEAFNELKQSNSTTIEKLSSRLENSLVNNESLKVEIEMLNLKYSDVKSGNEEALKQLEVEKAKLIDQLKNDLNDSHETITNLKNNLTVMEGNLAAKQHENESLKSTSDSLKEKVEFVQLRIQEKETTIKNMEIEIQKLTCDNKELTELKKSEISKLTVELNESNERFNNDIKSLEKKLELKETEILELQNNGSKSVANLNEELSNKSQKIQDLQNEINELKKMHEIELNFIKDTMKVKEDEFNKLKHESEISDQQLRDQVTQEKVNFENLNSQLGEMIKIHEEKKLEIEKLNDELEKIKSAHNDVLTSKQEVESKMKEEIDAFKLLLDKQILKNKTLKSKIQEINDKKEAGSQLEILEKKELTESLESLKEQLQNKSDELDLMIQGKKSVEDELAKLQMVCSDLESEASDKSKIIEKYTLLKNKNNILKEKIVSLETNNVKMEEELQVSKNEIQMLKNKLGSFEKREIESSKPLKVAGLDEALSQSLTSSQPIDRTPRKSLNILNTDPLDDVGLPAIMSSPIKMSPFNIHDDNIQEKDNTVDIGAVQRKKLKSKLSKKEQNIQQKENHENEMERKVETSKSNKKTYRALVNTKLSNLNKKTPLSNNSKLEAKLKKRKSTSPIKAGKKRVRSSVANEDSLEQLE